MVAKSVECVLRVQRDI